jgi:hypothetical protein
LITDAPPTDEDGGGGPEQATDGQDSTALVRLLNSLGDSQRPVTQPQVPSQGPGTPPSVVPPPSAPQTYGPPQGGPGQPITDPVPPAQPPVSPPTYQPTPPTGGGEQRPIAVGPLPAGFALPPRPALPPVPALVLPSSFCSADARNAFHDGPYIAAVEAAKRNNDAAIAYMHQLQELYDRNQLSGDINPMNALAAEARAFSPVASASFATQSALVSAFNAMMAVPIIACDPPK